VRLERTQDEAPARSRLVRAVERSPCRAQRHERGEHVAGFCGIVRLEHSAEDEASIVAWRNDRAHIRGRPLSCDGPFAAIQIANAGTCFVRGRTSLEPDRRGVAQVRRALAVARGLLPLNLGRQRKSGVLGEARQRRGAQLRRGVVPPERRANVVGEEVSPERDGSDVQPPPAEAAWEPSRHERRDQSAFAPLAVRLNQTGDLVLTEPESEVLARQEHQLIRRTNMADGSELAVAHESRAWLEVTPQLCRDLLRNTKPIRLAQRREHTSVRQRRTSELRSWPLAEGPRCRRRRRVGRAGPCCLHGRGARHWAPDMWRQLRAHHSPRPLLRRDDRRPDLGEVVR
jgi:hypothetical protein